MVLAGVASGGGREERRDTGDTLSFCLRKKLRV
jgi:hypothetical protein